MGKDELLMSCCARALGNISEEFINQTETDATGDVPNTTRTEKNNREKQSTQYLTRFGNVPTSSG